MGIGYEPLFRHVLLPFYDQTLAGRGTLSFLAEYERSQWLPPEQLQALRWTKLKRLLEHCWREVPYYRRQWTELGITPEAIRTPEDFARLPVLTKHDIRAHFESLKADSLRGSLLYKSTSGSTGEPFRFGYTRESNDRRAAVMWRSYGWAGSRPGRRTLYLWAVPAGLKPLQALKQRLYNRAYNRLMLDSFAMREDTMAEYADAIDAWRPEIVVGYVGPLVRLSQWLIASGRRIHRPAALLGAAESLHDFQREIIEQAFGAPAFNTYGCREFMLIASECERREGLHVNADHLHVEIGTPLPTAADRAAGEIIVTDLSNYGMPFIRYTTGDLATPAEAPCSCGRSLPLLAKVQGRKLDAIRTLDGRYLPGEYFPFIFNDVKWIKRFRIVQRRLEAIELQLVVDGQADAARLDAARALVARALGDGIAIDIRVVDDIPVAANGKFRVTVSELSDPPVP